MTEPPVVRGLGAWSFGYYELGMILPDAEQRPAERARVLAGIRAFKVSLVDSGHGKGIVLKSPESFGTAVRDRVIDVQLENGLTRAAGYTPGRIGSAVARILHRTYSFEAEDRRGIPDHLVQRLICHESSHDPVAEGYYDPDDEGLGQIHMPFNVAVTLEQAWSPGFAVPWTADRMAGAFHTVGDDWDGAVAGHNVGTQTAKRWVAEGKPAAGGPIIYGQDAWVRATGYVAAVRAMPL